MSNDELLPCPLCGGEPVMFPRAVMYPDWWQCTIVHDECGENDRHYVQVVAEGDTEQEAIRAAVAAWNHRDACFHCQYGAKPMTEENMRAEGWVRERTCHDTGVRYPGWTCSECGYEGSSSPNYCPNCGRKVER